MSRKSERGHDIGWGKRERKGKTTNWRGRKNREYEVSNKK